jgi:heme-degrading monooxygenase HmoA
MYVVREVMRCKPGKVRDMVNKFKGLSGVMHKMGLKGFRVLTDVSGEQFWTVVAETEFDSLDDFVAMEEKVMANEEARKIMGGYHDLVEKGRREIYKAES